MRKVQISIESPDTFDSIDQLETVIDAKGQRIKQRLFEVAKWTWYYFSPFRMRMRSNAFSAWLPPGSSCTTFWCSAKASVFSPIRS